MSKIFEVRSIEKSSSVERRLHSNRRELHHLFSKASGPDDPDLSGSQSAEASEKKAANSHSMDRWEDEDAPVHESRILREIRRASLVPYQVLQKYPPLQPTEQELLEEECGPGSGRRVGRKKAAETPSMLRVKAHFAALSSGRAGSKLLPSLNEPRLLKKQKGGCASIGRLRPLCRQRPWTDGPLVPTWLKRSHLWAKLPCGLYLCLASQCLSRCEVLNLHSQADGRPKLCWTRGRLQQPPAAAEEPCPQSASPSTLERAARKPVGRQQWHQHRSGLHLHPARAPRAPSLGDSCW